MNLTFDPDGWNDDRLWQPTDRPMRRKIDVPINDCLPPPRRKSGKARAAPGRSRRA
jgi:Txe/YoeB family toxin of Txe-Axe toxin-antitoxin module